MKNAILTAFLLSLICLSLFAFITQTPEYYKKKVNDVLIQIPQLLREDPTGIKAQKFIHQNQVSGCISSFYQSVEGFMWKDSEEKRNRIKEMDKVLAPHEKAIVDLTFLTQSNADAIQASIQILQYFPPTSSLRESLIKLINMPINSAREADLCVEGYETIFKLELDDSKFRQQIVKYIKENRMFYNDSKEARIANQLYSYLSNLGIPDFKELFIQDISTPIIPKNYPYGKDRHILISWIRTAARGLSYYGVLAKEYLDTIKLRLSELDPANPGEIGSIEELNKIMFILEGKLPPERAYSMKGQLLGISKEAYPLWLKNNPPKIKTEEDIKKEKEYHEKIFKKFQQHTEKIKDSKYVKAEQERMLSAAIENTKKQGYTVVKSNNSDSYIKTLLWILSAVFLLGLCGIILYRKTRIKNL
jgi:hypothetical protein